MWTCINMQKIRPFCWFFMEIWLSKKSCNQIGWEHFGPYLGNKTFPKYGIFCAWTQQILKVFIPIQIQKKWMTKCFNKFKKPCFWPIFGPFSDFWAKKFPPENPALSCTTSYGFLASCQNSEKTNDTTISRKRLGRRTDGRTKGRTDPIL